MKHNFKVGDRVKQIKNLNEDENPFATITRIDDNRIWHRHDGKNRENNSVAKDFILLKETNWKKRIQNG